MTDQINATVRTEFGKGAARRIRRADKVPAVVYGHGTDPRHIALPGHETMLAVKQANAVLTIDLEGEEILALAKDVQRDPVKRTIEHVDLVIVRRGEKVTVDVAVHTTGEAAPETVVTVDAQTLSLEVEATHIPEYVEVSVEGLEAGTQIVASEVTLPEGAELLTEPETLVVNVTQQISEEALEAELETEGGEESQESAEDEQAPESGEEAPEAGEESE